MDKDFLLRAAQIVATLLTPITVTVLGVVIVRHIEGIKADATKRSAFHVSLRALEREIAILIILSQRVEKNDEDGMKIQQEQGEVHSLAYELKLRIRRCAGFAPLNRDRISELAEDSFSLVNNLIGAKQSRLDPVFQKLNEFNDCARKTHAEILALEQVDHKRKNGI